MLLENGIVRIEDAPKDFIYRPSGRLRDGTSGFWEIKKHGGIAMAQAPYEAKCPAMPESAIANVGQRLAVARTYSVRYDKYGSGGVIACSDFRFRT